MAMSVDAFHHHARVCVCGARVCVRSLLRLHVPRRPCRRRHMLGYYCLWRAVLIGLRRSGGWHRAHACGTRRAGWARATHAHAARFPHLFARKRTAHHFLFWILLPLPPSLPWPPPPPAAPAYFWRIQTESACAILPGRSSPGPHCPASRLPPALLAAAAGLVPRNVRSCHVPAYLQYGGMCFCTGVASLGAPPASLSLVSDNVTPLAVLTPHVFRGGGGGSWRGWGRQTRPGGRIR